MVGSMSMSRRTVLGGVLMGAFAPMRGSLPGARRRSEMKPVVRGRPDATLGSHARRR